MYAAQGRAAVATEKFASHRHFQESNFPGLLPFVEKHVESR